MTMNQGTNFVLTGTEQLAMRSDSVKSTRPKRLLAKWQSSLLVTEATASVSSDYPVAGVDEARRYIKPIDKGEGASLLLEMIVKELAISLNFATPRSVMIQQTASIDMMSTLTDLVTSSVNVGDVFQHCMDEHDRVKDTSSDTESTTSTESSDDDSDAASNMLVSAICVESRELVPPDDTRTPGSIEAPLLSTGPLQDQTPSLADVVRFEGVTVRYYNRALCLNPACTNGPSLGLGWEFHEKAFDFAEWEQERTPVAGILELIMSADERLKMVRELGYTRREIASAVRETNKLRNKRLNTINTMEFAKMEEVVEKVKRRAKKIMFM